MATCININAPEFQAIKKSLGSEVKAYSAVSTWQEANNSTDIPTYDDIKEMYNVQKALVEDNMDVFKKQLLGNLLKLDLVVKDELDADNYNIVIQGTDVEIESKAEKIQNYLSVNNIPSSAVNFKIVQNLTEDRSEYEKYHGNIFLDVNEEYLDEEDIIPETRSNYSPKTTHILEHLGNILPQVNIEEIPSWEGEAFFNNIPERIRGNVEFDEVKSFYDPITNTSFILTDRVDDETAIEEVLHPFVTALRLENPKLFKGLLQEAGKNFQQLAADINELYTDEKGFNELGRQEELVTKALSRHFLKEYTQEPTKSFLDKVKDFLQWFFDTIVNTLYKSITGKSLKSTRIEDVQREVEQFSDVTEEDIQQVQDIFKKDKRLANAVYYNTGISKEIEDTNLAQRRAKYAAQNKIMQAKRQTFANDRGMDATSKELKKINTPESNLLADLMTVEQVNIKAKSFDYRTPEGKAKSQAQYDIKNKLLVKIFNQYKELGYEVKYEPSFIPGIRHTLFFTIPNTDIQLSYHGNYETIENEIVKLPEGKWDKIPGATFHKLEEAALRIIGEENNDKTEWRNGIDLGQQFTQIDFVPTPEEKMFAENIYAEYMKEMSKNPETAEILNSKLNADTFKNYFNNKLANAAANIESIELTVDMIQPTLTLSDVAKMLNTTDIVFDFNLSADFKVQYSLSKEKQSLINEIKETALEAQKNVIDNLTGAVINNKRKVDQFTVSSKNEPKNVTIYDQKKNVYKNLKGQTYNSVESLIIGEQVTKDTSQKVANDLNKIVEAFIMDKPLSDYKFQSLNEEQAEAAFDQIISYIELIRDDFSAILPNVVVSSEFYGMADTVSVVLISTAGHLKLLNFNVMEGTLDSEVKIDQNSALKVESLTTKQKNGIRLQIQKTMFEHLGYTVEKIASINVNINPKKGKVKGEAKFVSVTNYKDSYQEPLVYKIIPEIGPYSNFRSFEEGTIELEEFETKDEYLEELRVLTEGIDTYKKNLITKRQALNRISSKIYTKDGVKNETANIQQIISLINTLDRDDLVTVRSYYADFLKKAIREAKSFKDFLQDPKNFGKEEFVSYALNAKRFAKTYRGLYSMKNTSVFAKKNDGLSNLLFTLQTLLNEIAGTTNDEMNISDQAIFDHVKFIINKITSQELTEEELDLLMKESQDIGLLELNFRDTATSRDVLLRVMDKLFHQKKMKYFSIMTPLEQKIKRAAQKLYKLSPEKDPEKIYKFMLNDNGTIIKRHSNRYLKKYFELLDKITLEDGQRKKFIEIPNLEGASQKDLEYNIDLALKRREFNEYVRYEYSSETGKLMDGEYRIVSDWFKKKRAKYEVWKTYKANGKKFGRWVKRKDVSDDAWLRYKIKYFTSKDNYLTMTYDNDFPTGVTDIKEQSWFLKPIVGTREIIKIRDVDAFGETMLDERYIKMQNPQTALEKAQLEFYNVYDEVYNASLNVLPIGVKNKMLGKIPVIANKLLMNTDEKSNAVTSLFTKMTNNFNDIFTGTMEQRAVVTDENGDLVNELPVYYTGSLRSEKQLQEVEDKINKLQDDYRKGDVNPDQYKERMKLLKGERKAIRSRPTAKELSLDLGTNLIRFTQMAVHFDVMQEAEDTLNSFVKVIEQKKYNSASQNTVLGRMVDGVFKREAVIKGENSNVLKRAKDFMEMIFYDVPEMSKNQLELAADALLQYTSFAYVGLNPFGSFNNYAYARISNYVEVFGGNRFFKRRHYIRAEKEFNKHGFLGIFERISASTKRLKKSSIYAVNQPLNKYEAFVDFFRMMDSLADQREQSFQLGNKSYFQRFVNWSYILQDMGEYNVQTKVGMAIIMGKYIKNSQTGDFLSFYDAYDFDAKTGELKIKDGYDTLVDENGNELKDKFGKTVKYNDEFRANLRAEIRNVNKQIHGNYARDDRMRIQSHMLGKFAAQFHKWVAPAIAARYQREYYDENLGWMEGRYISAMRFVKHIFNEVHKGNLNFMSYNEEFKKKYKFKGDGSQSDQKILNRMQGFYRSLGEAAMVALILMVKDLIMMGFDEDDDEKLTGIQRKFKNILLYQTDRTYKDMVVFFPVVPTGATQVYQLFKSPIASTRTLGELGEALSYTIFHPIVYLASSEEDFINNKDYVYQRGIRKGQYKLYKNWADVVPGLYTAKKWQDYDTLQNFFIK